jgi:hypothetical protein
MKNTLDYDLFVAAKDKLGRAFETWKRLTTLRQHVQDLKAELKEARERMAITEMEFYSVMREVTEINESAATKDGK